MKKNSLYLVTLIIFMATSCVTHQKMLLLRNNGQTVQDTLQQRLISQYRLQSGDILDVKVSSLEPNSVAIFNKAVGGAVSANTSTSSLYVNGYMIDHFGAINVPLIGDLPVEGLTLDSLNHVLDVKLAEYFKFFTVEAKLVNYRVSVLGEVNSPGTQIVYNSDLNLLQALSNAGGIKDHGNRRKIKVIRKAFGTNEIQILDLSEQEVVNDDFFYMMPNDVVYIEPYKSKVVAINTPLFALLMSVVSFSILLISTVSK